MEIKKAKTIINQIIDLYVPEYKVEYVYSKEFYGACDLEKKVLYFSIPLIKFNDEELFVNALFHELCHIISGKRYHSKEWRKCMLMFGYAPDTQLPATTFKAKEMYCPECNTKKKIPQNYVKRAICPFCYLHDRKKIIMRC